MDREAIIVTDPVHQVMNLGSDGRTRETLRRVLDTRAFQRLRRISQLGLTSFVFPGATHSRFSHCLGVTHLSRVVLRHLHETSLPEEKKEVEDLELEVMLAGLLHDVGHGPFSHSFENVLKGMAEIQDPPLHEDWTAEFIRNEKSEINQALRDTNVDLEQISSVFSSKADGKTMPRYLKQIISSQIDVDRMDYLVRDSHFAGVAIGQIDIQYIINCLKVIHHGATKDLGLTPKGIKAYEGFVSSRQLMNKTLYYHHTVKTLEFMMEELIRQILRHSVELEEIAEISWLIPSYFKALSSIFVEGADYHKDRFIRENIDSYSRLTEDSVWNLITSIAEAPRDAKIPDYVAHLARRILERDVFGYYPVKPGKKEVLRAELDAAKLFSDEHMALVSLATTMYKESKDKVFVVDWDDEIKEIVAHSSTISMLSNRPEVEDLLIIIDNEKKEEIKKIASDAQTITLKSEKQLLLEETE